MGAFRQTFSKLQYIVQNKQKNNSRKCGQRSMTDTDELVCQTVLEITYNAYRSNNFKFTF